VTVLFLGQEGEDAIARGVDVPVQRLERGEARRRLRGGHEGAKRGEVRLAHRLVARLRVLLHHALRAPGVGVALLVPGVLHRVGERANGGEGGQGRDARGAGPEVEPEDGGGAAEI
jgi:hypothetical protein